MEQNEKNSRRRDEKSTHAEMEQNENTPRRRDEKSNHAETKRELPHAEEMRRAPMLKQNNKIPHVGEMRRASLLKPKNKNSNWRTRTVA